MSFGEWIDRVEHCMVEGFCAPYFSYLNTIMKQLGKCLVVFVHLITIFIAITGFCVILPYEQRYQPLWLLAIYSVLGVYFLINIMYHYTKARLLPPLPGFGKSGDRWCVACQNWKCDRTHHCSVCRTCVLGMDHHCIWINQCVGNHNHRHFFLFISHLTLTGLMIVAAGGHSFYDHIFMFDHNYCNVQLDYAPLQGHICEFGELARNSIIFCYMLSFLLFLLVGGLALWNVYLISKGFTYVDYLKGWDGRPTGYRNPYHHGFVENWRNFLGLRRNRTFLRHVLLPSAHPPIILDQNGELEIGFQPLNTHASRSESDEMLV
ncbi:unnamed protein product, partial [Mesorhabditis spiculigera]